MTKPIRKVPAGVKLQLPLRHARFVAEFLKDLNASQAAIRAGYGPKWAAKNAHRLTENEGIKAAIERRTARQVETVELSATRVLEELRRLSFVDATGIWDSAGHIKPFSKWTVEQRASLAGFEAIIKNAAAGDRKTDLVHKVKLYDKTRALDLLARHFALLHDQVKVEGVDWKEIAALLAAARKKDREKG